IALVFFCSALLALAQNPPPSATNHVLDLDGEGSYVELPPNIFTNLSAATVEGWVKWRRLVGYSRFFDFGRASNDVSVITHDHSPDLRFNLYPANAPRRVLRVNGAVKTNEWLHIAAVSGPGGMKFYLNGQLAAQTNYTGSFATITNDERNLLGRGLWKNPNDEDFDGQMDEVRVWDHERTPEQILTNMNLRLTGGEPGVVGLWNFDNVDGATVKDAGPRQLHGKLMGEARAVEEILP